VPQLFESLARLTHALVGPSLPYVVATTSLAAHAVTHAPFEHACPAAHALPQAPQCFAELASATQRPSHSAWFGGQEEVHVPPTQTSLLLQTVPHAPQFCGWLKGSTQPFPQTMRPLAQVPSPKSKATGSVLLGVGLVLLLLQPAVDAKGTAATRQAATTKRRIFKGDSVGFVGRRGVRAPASKGEAIPFDRDRRAWIAEIAVSSTSARVVPRQRANGRAYGASKSRSVSSGPRACDQAGLSAVRCAHATRRG
jgi:hypothetical protein